MKTSEVSRYRACSVLAHQIHMQNICSPVQPILWPDFADALHPFFDKIGQLFVPLERFLSALVAGCHTAPRLGKQFNLFDNVLSHGGAS